MVRLVVGRRLDLGRDLERRRERTGRERHRSGEGRERWRKGGMKGMRESVIGLGKIINKKLKIYVVWCKKL